MGKDVFRRSNNRGNPRFVIGPQKSRPIGMNQGFAFMGCQSRINSGIETKPFSKVYRFSIVIFNKVGFHIFARNIGRCIHMGQKADRGAGFHTRAGWNSGY
jgi:hypothetical protein